MFFSNKKYYATQYAVAIVGFCLALLTGCSDDNHKKASSSSVSSSSVSSSSALSSSSSNTSSSSSSLINSPEVGQWYAPAYGYVLSVSAEGDIFTVKTYSVTENYCLLQNVDANLALAELKHKYIHSNIARETLLESKGDYPPGVEYEKVKQLPAVCEENLQKVKTDSGYNFDAKKDLEIFWQTFHELYINFELRGVNWNEAYKTALTSVDNVENEEELFEFLSTLIAPLGDGHAVLIKTPLSQSLDESITAAFENEETPIFSASTQLTIYQKITNEYMQTLEPELTDAQMESADDYFLINYSKIFDNIFGYADELFDIKERAAGEIVWFKTNNNIGYLIIGSMSDYTEGKSTVISDIASDVAIAEAAISDALKDLEDTDGLIIDIRVNGGGQDQVALTFVRHFMNQSQVVYSKSAGHGAWATPTQDVVLDPQSDNIYLKPTAVLVSGDTASAAELFTIAMASLPQVTIIGEPTAGAFSDILVKRLTSDILFGISNETYLDTQGNNYEGVGIPADIVVPFGTLQEREVGYDGGIDAAINWIKSAP
ncbi:MAG: S41 family peptidase [Cellvibrio sp.]|uniref:S41 family peptidase n=1 Tax=Cellvibrio sp. TaxID=1965322 RepID=UPI0027184EC2|nr:S41 family peptidase [Cellvibrio sp.]